eukprot:TRINITY_DN22694_c0_g1_i1.p1 TRINITY_DN22694_c0_g1~~TRINITY_DN22694_c0_g1_i1.p1  ORF type:complete len:303 (+),score=60.80 TRINITY_DN22694_c0_g1_i1:147-1055(+)
MAAEDHQLRGCHQLMFLPRCAVLMQYGGGDEMRQGESILPLSLHPSAIPTELRQSVSDSVVGVLKMRAEGAFDATTARHIPEEWDADACEWEAALSICAMPPSEKDWANLYFHGWLFSELAQSTPQPGAAQRFPLIGVWEPRGGLSVWSEDERGTVRSALRPADQHIHKVDAYAGGDRESTIALYIESGYDRETAEAVLTADEADCDTYHVGADAARGRVSPGAQESWGWVACVDMEGSKVQICLMVVLSSELEAGGLFRRLSFSEKSAAEARAELASCLVDTCLHPELTELLNDVLCAGAH